MSSTNGGGEGESGEAQSRGKDELPGTKDRMRLQQRLIDMAARDLESTRSSYREIAPGSEHGFSCTRGKHFVARGKNGVMPNNQLAPP